MSFEKKYDKVILGAGIGLAILAAGWTYMQVNSYSTAYASSPELPDKNPPVEGTAKAESLLTELDASHRIDRPAVGKQFFDVFVGPFLVNRKGENTAQDIYTSTPIHKDIPNSWFIENGLDDVFKMSNAADVDSDNDGFTNHEEFIAKTKPNSAKSYPDLIDKINGGAIKFQVFDLAFSSEADPIEFRGERHNARPGDQPLWKQEVKIGDTFGQKPSLNRFKLVKIDKVVTEDEMEESIATVEDLKPEKKGTVYPIKAGKRNAQRILDLSATVTLSAGPERGEFTVEEGKTFTIPGDPAQTVYSVEKIDIKEKTLSFKNAATGKTSTLTFTN